MRFDLGSASLGGPGFIATSPHAQATFAAQLFAAADGKRVNVERVELSMPGRAPLATPLARSTLTATLGQGDKLEHKRGATVAVTLEGDLGDSTGTVHVRVKAATFVRDVVTARAMYAGKLGGPSLFPGFGDAGAMR